MAFTLRIFESEFKEIEDFVLKYPNIETGGDLFGLWQANEDPVVQLIIGPGQNCRRTSVSFHQDTNYLAKFGTFVNSSYMLCHIGSWHSHHQLSLSQPSAGDRSTVCNNFPQGLPRYIMIIANIQRSASSRYSSSVVIHPYMFTNGGHVCKQGRVHKIPGSSPFRDVGFVLSELNQGAEHVSIDRRTEYHQRPSTQSKPMSRALESVPKYPSPKKYEQSSTHSKPSYEWTESSHHRLTNDADHHSPMETDNPGDQPKSQYQALGSSNTRKSLQHKNDFHESNTSEEATQWYETERGGSKLKDIHQEIIGTNMASKIDFYRDSQSKNLTMQFIHHGQKWVIKFPKSFDDEPAVIDCCYGNMQSINVVKHIREACKCSQCQEHQRQHSPSRQDYHKPSSPSKQNHYSPYPSQLPSRRSFTSPTQPWYNTQSGKAIFENIKTDIETYVKATSNGSRVRVRDLTPSSSKELIFYHHSCDWVIEFVNSSRVISIMKIDQGGGVKRSVAKLSSPYDVVSQLNQHCPCSRCRAEKQPPSSQRRKRPNSRYANSQYGANDVHHSPPTRASPTPSYNKFFASTNGEERFRRVCNDISLLFLDGRRVDISRMLLSTDITVKFQHGPRSWQWKIDFPFSFPNQMPKLSYTRTSGRYYPIQVTSVDDICRNIRMYCACSSCRQYSLRYI